MLPYLSRYLLAVHYSSTPSDRAGMYNVCLQTGDSGQDATHLYKEDPNAIGNRWVGAYMHLQPNLAYCLVDNEGVCGYTLGALDSHQFYPRLIREWLTPLATKYAEPTDNNDIKQREEWTPTQKMYYEYHHPTFFFPPLLYRHPSHLHIDLLPRAQRKGLGTKLIER
jgi:hypothetical protein